MEIEHLAARENAGDPEALHLYDIRAVSDRGRPFHFKTRGTLRDPNPAPMDMIRHDDTPEAIDAIAKREFIARARIMAHRDDASHREAFVLVSDSTLVDDTQGAPTVHLDTRRALSELWVGVSMIAGSIVLGAVSVFLLHVTSDCDPHCDELAPAVALVPGVGALAFLAAGLAFIYHGVTVRHEEARASDSEDFVLRPQRESGAR